jgi:hypothetical protein
VTAPRKEIAEPSHNRLLERVRKYREQRRRQALEELFARVSIAIKQTRARKEKVELQKLSREIKDDLYPRGSWLRALYESKSKRRPGAPRKNAIAEQAALLRERGMNFPQIAAELKKRGIETTPDAVRKLLKRHSKPDKI